jgi:hypothetical protein
MGVSSRIRRSALATAATILLLPAAAGAATITFEDLVPHPPPTGGGGLTVNSFYSSQGVTFNNPSAFDYGGGFAHSGVVGVEPCVAQEFCSSPIRVDFTTGQMSVGAWVGFSFAPTPAFPIRLTAYDGSSNVVAIDDDTIPASSGRTPIQTHLSVGPGPPTIRRMEISVPGGFTGGVAVDDIEFSATGPPPPCTATAPPTITLEQPRSLTTVQNNEFVLEGNVDPHGGEITSASISATSEGGTTHAGPIFPALIDGDGGSLGPVRVNGFLFDPAPGKNDIVVSASNCKGTGTSDTRTVFWTPLPPTTSFRQLGVIEVTQGIQTTFNSVPLVASNGGGAKRTFARVYLRAEGGASGVSHVTGTLTATLPDGSRAPGPLRVSSINPGPAYGFIEDAPVDVIRDRIDDPLIFELPPEWTQAGRIHLQLEHVYIESAESHFPCNGCDNVSFTGVPSHLAPSTVGFHEAPPVRVTLISMPYNPAGGGAPKITSQTEIDNIASLLQRMYPTSRVMVNQATMPIQDPPATCKQARDRVRDFAGALAAQDTRMRFYGMLEDDDASITVKDKDGNVVGGCMDQPGQFGWGEVRGPSKDFGFFTAAHELGHSYGRPHVSGQGRPDCELFEGSAVDSGYPHSGGLIGDTIFGDAVGLDPGDAALSVRGQVLDWRDNVSDVMTYCPEKWLSDWNWGHIFGRLCTEDPGNCPDKQAITGQPRRRAKLVAPGRKGAGKPALVVRGSLNKPGRASLQSLAVLSGQDLTRRVKRSPYAVVLRGSGGRVLARYPFKPAPASEAAPDSIDVVMPFKPATERIEITKGKRRLASRGVSAHAPKVTVSAVNAGKRAKHARLRWRAHDPDGGRLTYTVLYTPGGKNDYLPIAAGLRKRSARVDLSSLPGGHKARFQVIASDGVRTGSDVSRPLKVKAKAPHVLISSAGSGVEIPADQTIELVASVRDLQDVPFKAAKVSWASSLQGNLGTGTTINATLTPGTHEITATATNSAGKRGLATVIVHVAAVPPVFTVP